MAEELTDKQVHEHLVKLADARLRADSNHRSGWQHAYETPNGTVVYGFVKDGHVTEVGFGSKNFAKALDRYVPTGAVGPLAGGGVELHQPTGTHDHGALTGGGVVLEPSGGGGQPDTSGCARKLLDCLGREGFRGLIGGFRLLKNLASLDFKDIEAQIDSADKQKRKCLGKVCADYFEVPE